MKTMPVVKNVALALLSGLFFVFSSSHAKAARVWGADISWTCKGDSTFLITLTVYGDCNTGQPGASTLSLHSQNSKCSNTILTYTGGTLVNGKDITPVCNKYCTRCSNSSCSFPFGIEQWEINQTVHFSSTACCNYEIQWGECCRDSSLTTIKPGRFFINALLDRCDTPCNNSPYFTSPPISVIAANKCYIFNYGVTDNNLDALGNPDSLLYELVNPLDSESLPVTWNAPYNYLEPLKYFGAFGNPNAKWGASNNNCKGFHLDSATGNLYFKPMKTDTTDFALQVQTWKINALGIPYMSSYVTRDAEIIIIDSNSNHLPTITGINGTYAKTIDYCVDKTTCFTIVTYDQDQTDSVTVTWDTALAPLGATFTANNGVVKHPVGKFCWKPTQARSYPYYFTITAQDNACPLNGRTSQSYSIIVHPHPEANYSWYESGCGFVQFSASPVVGNGIPGIASYTWFGTGAPPIYATSQNFSHKYRKWGTYPFTLTITANPPPTPSCEYIYTDSVIIPQSVEVSLPRHDTTVLTGTTMRISANAFLGTTPYTYSWNCSSSTNSYIYYTFTQNTPVVVYVSDADGCNNYDSMNVNVANLVALFDVPDSNCLSSKVYFIDSSKVDSVCGTIKKWLWSFGDGATDTLQNTEHTYTKRGNYIAKLKITTTSGCTDSFTRPIYIDSPCVPSVQAHFSVAAINCLDSLVSFYDSSTTKFCGGIKSWYWFFGDGGTDSVENPMHIYANTGVYNVRLTVLTYDSCSSSYTKTITIDSCNTSGIQPFSSGYYSINIYPNPVNNTLNIDAGKNVLNSVTVYDAMGRDIRTKTGVQSGVISIPTSALPAGIYFLRLGIGDGFYMTRFVKE